MVVVLNYKAEDLGLVKEASRSCCWFNRCDNSCKCCWEEDHSGWGWERGSVGMKLGEGIQKYFSSGPGGPWRVIRCEVEEGELDIRTLVFWLGGWDGWGPITREGETGDKCCLGWRRGEAEGFCGFAGLEGTTVILMEWSDGSSWSCDWRLGPGPIGGLGNHGAV